MDFLVRGLNRALDLIEFNNNANHPTNGSSPPGSPKQPIKKQKIEIIPNDAMRDDIAVRVVFTSNFALEIFKYCKLSELTCLRRVCHVFYEQVTKSFWTQKLMEHPFWVQYGQHSNQRLLENPKKAFEELEQRRINEITFVTTDLYFQKGQLKAPCSVLEEAHETNEYFVPKELLQEKIKKIAVNTKQAALNVLSHLALIENTEGEVELYCWESVILGMKVMTNRRVLPVPVEKAPISFLQIHRLGMLTFALVVHRTGVQFFYLKKKDTKECMEGIPHILKLPNDEPIACVVDTQYRSPHNSDEHVFLVSGKNGTIKACQTTINTLQNAETKKPFQEVPIIFLDRDSLKDLRGPLRSVMMSAVDDSFYVHSDESNSGLISIFLVMQNHKENKTIIREQKPIRLDFPISSFCLVHANLATTYIIAGSNEGHIYIITYNPLSQTVSNVKHIKDLVAKGRIMNVSFENSYEVLGKEGSLVYNGPAILIAQGFLQKPAQLVVLPTSSDLISKVQTPLYPALYPV